MMKEKTFERRRRRNDEKAFQEAIFIEERVSQNLLEFNLLGLDKLVSFEKDKYHA